MIDLGNSEIVSVEQCSTREEDEQLEINLIDESPKMWLKSIVGSYKGKKTTLKVKGAEEKSFTIGRYPNHDLCLSQSPMISRTHAKLYYSDECNWELEDQGSRAGTYICIGNNKCYSSLQSSELAVFDVDISREIEHGDIIVIPGVEFIVKLN